MHENITFYRDNKVYLMGVLKLEKLPAVVNTRGQSVAS